MINCNIAGVRFNYRVAGVLIDDGSVLLNRITTFDHWFLPGGRVEVMEASHESLEREMREELEITVRVERLLWVVETFLDGAHGRVHEIGLYYAAALPSDSPYADKSAIHRRVTEAGDDVLFQWFPLNRLADLNLVPPFLKERLPCLPDGTQHLIDRQQVARQSRAQLP